MRKPRHLITIEDSKNGNFNLDNKKSKKVDELLNTVKSLREDEHKYMANIYAKSLGHVGPNILKNSKIFSHWYDEECKQKKE